MSAFVLIAGSLMRAPEQRTSKAGKPYCTATLKVANGAEIEFWNVVAFEPVQATLADIAEGEKLAVQGRLQIGTYDKAGVTKLSRSVTADCVLTLKQPPRERRGKTDARRSAAPASADGPDDWASR